MTAYCSIFPTPPEYIVAFKGCSAVGKKQRIVKGIYLYCQPFCFKWRSAGTSSDCPAPCRHSLRRCSHPYCCIAANSMVYMSKNLFRGADRMKSISGIILLSLYLALAGCASQGSLESTRNDI